MELLSFDAEAKDGTLTIKIPQEYLKDTTTKFQVIVLIEGEQEKLKTAKVKKFEAFRVDTQGLFDRETANKRR